MSDTKIRSFVTGAFVTLMEKGTATAAEIGINSVEAIRLEEQRFLRRAGVVRTESRGRPAIIWRLTDKARKRVKRAQAA